MVNDPVKGIYRRPPCELLLDNLDFSQTGMDTLFEEGLHLSSNITVNSVNKNIQTRSFYFGSMTNISRILTVYPEEV
jgi:hypothetical protein